MIPPNTAVAKSVGSETQHEAFREMVDRCELELASAGKALIAAHYNVGKILIEVFDDMQQNNSAKFGPNPIDRMAEVMEVEKSTLYRCQQAAVKFSDAHMEQILSTNNVKWSHVRAALKVPDTERGVHMLISLDEDRKTVVEFEKQVNEEVEEEKNLHKEDTGETESTGNAGGGSRTGSGHGPSPFTPVRRALKHSEGLGKELPDALIALKEADPQSESAQTALTTLVEECLGSLASSIQSVAGFLLEAEDHMAFHIDGPARREAQGARMSAYDQVVTELSKLVGKGKDGTLGSGEQKADD